MQNNNNSNNYCQQDLLLVLAPAECVLERREARVSIRAAFKYSVSRCPNNAVHPGRRRSAPSTASTGKDQRHPPPSPPHLKPITKISARNLKSDEWSVVAIRPEHGPGASAADTGFVEDVVPRALPVCLEQSSTPTASSVPADLGARIDD